MLNYRQRSVYSHTHNHLLAPPVDDAAVASGTAVEEEEEEGVLGSD